MINEIIEVILQILVFTLIPFLVFVIKYKSNKGFFELYRFKEIDYKGELSCCSCLFNNCCTDLNSGSDQFRVQGNNDCTKKYYRKIPSNGI